MSGKPKRPVSKSGEPPFEGWSQEEVAAQVPCAQGTISRYQRRGELTELPNRKLAKVAVDEARALLEAHDLGGDIDPETKRRLDLATMRLREAQAKIREFELERESGKFIELAIVERDGADTGERVLAVLRAIGQRVALALECSCRSAAVAKKAVDEEVERAIGELRDSLYIVPPEEE